MRIFKKALEFLSVGAIGLMLAFVPAVALTGCSASSDLQKVLALLPTIEEVSNSVLTVVATLDPALGAPIKLAVQGVEAGLQEAGQIITAYQSNIANMPDTVVAKLDALIAAIQSNLESIQQAFPQLPSIVVAGITVGLLAFQSILSLIASIVPAEAAMLMFPKSFKALSLHGVMFGVQSGPIPSPREFAKDYNQKISQAGFKSARIHVPWIMHVIP